MSGRTLVGALVASQLWLGVAAFSQVVLSAVSLYGEVYVDVFATYGAVLGAAVALYYWGYRNFPTSVRGRATLGSIAAIVAYALVHSLPDAPPAITALGFPLAALYFVAGSRFRSSAWFGYGKAALLAVVWTYYTTSAIGYAYHVHIVAYTASRLCLFLAIALCFDYRDQAPDTRAGLRTLTTKLGRRRAKYLATVLMTTALALPWSAPLAIMERGLLITTVVSAVGLPLVWWAFRQNRPPVLYYDLVLDGLLVLPLPIYLMLSALS